MIVFNRSFAYNYLCRFSIVIFSLKIFHIHCNCFHTIMQLLYKSYLSYTRLETNTHNYFNKIYHLTLNGGTSITNANKTSSSESQLAFYYNASEKIMINFTNLYIKFDCKHVTNSKYIDELSVSNFCSGEPKDCINLVQPIYGNYLKLLTQNIRSISANILGFLMLLSRLNLTQDIKVLSVGSLVIPIFHL